MRLAKISYVTSARTEASKWTATEDTILFLMVGSGATYAQIALRLGRSEGAVQRRASRNGLSQRAEASAQGKTRKNLSEARRTALLAAEEASLAAYVPECDEDPVIPHTGGRTYHREYYAEHDRKTAKAQSRKRLKKIP